MRRSPTQSKVFSKVSFCSFILIITITSIVIVVIIIIIHLHCCSGSDAETAHRRWWTKLSDS